MKLKYSLPEKPFTELARIFALIAILAYMSLRFDLSMFDQVAFVFGLMFLISELPKVSFGYITISVKLDEIKEEERPQEIIPEKLGLDNPVYKVEPKPKRKPTVKKQVVPSKEEIFEKIVEEKKEQITTKPKRIRNVKPKQI